MTWKWRRELIKYARDWSIEFQYLRIGEDVLLLFPLRCDRNSVVVHNEAVVVALVLLLVIVHITDAGSFLLQLLAALVLLWTCRDECDWLVECKTFINSVSLLL